MGLTCSACHKPHAPPAEALVACRVCHPKIDKDGLHGRHTKEPCRGCHTPHTWKAKEAGCARCHAKLAEAHPARRDCFACHGFRPLIPAGKPVSPKRT
jgi:hypothetical protein